MKTLFLILILGCAAAICASAQPAQPAAHRSGVHGVCSIVERGPYYRIWEISPDTAGEQANLKAHRVVELATGMHYWDGQNWSPSDPSFEVTPDGFVAGKVQHQIRLASDLNVIGVVSVNTPNGTTLRSTPVGIGLYDAASGEFALLGAITNCAGVLVSSNKVVYENAFSGVSADIIYTLERGSFQQDVLLTAPLDPADYGFPPETTRIQILTEFYQGPVPEVVRHPIRVEKQEAVRKRMASPDLVDETLSFGGTTFAAGHAFSVAPVSTSAAVKAPVAKEFKTIGGRRFLIESVEYGAIKRGLESLSKARRQAGLSQPKRQPAKSGYAAIPKPSRTAQSAAAPRRSSTQLASLTSAQRPGVVIDYIVVVGNLDDPYVFRGDTTYFVSGPVYCGQVTIEGGAVIKYADTFESYKFIQVNGSLNCAASSYRPAVFTAADDDSVGQSMNVSIWPRYTGDPTGKHYASPALLFPSYPPTVAMNNLRFCYAEQVASITTTYGQITLNHSQLLDCNVGISLMGSGGIVTANNCLFTGVGTVCEEDGVSGGLANWSLSNCTIDNSSPFWNPNTWDTTSTLNCINCILANVSFEYGYYITPTGDHNGFYNSTQFGDNQFTPLDSNSPFQRVGSGGYYLTDTSGFRNAGTTSGLASSLLNDLKKRTTYPPVVYANTTMSTDRTFSPGAQRDADTPDLGYHYDPLDYVFGGVTANANLTFTPGTAVGWFPTPESYEEGHRAYGIQLADTKTATFNGTATQQDYWVRHNTVQETPGLGEGLYGSAGITGHTWPNFNQAPQVTLRFTKCTGLANDSMFLRDNSAVQNDDYGYLVAHATDCEFYSGGVGGDASQLGFTNCLFERMSVWTSWDEVPSPQCSFTFRNCLMHAGVLSLRRGGTTSCPWVIKDTAFDGTSFSLTDGASGNPAITDFDYNAFLQGASHTGLQGLHDVSVPGSFNWQSSGLRNYYLPSDSLLIDAGSFTDAGQAGLYHYTTQVGQTKELHSRLDIGYHYVALDGSNNPFDTNGDGVPDYLQDKNGNGLADSGEYDWVHVPTTVPAGLVSWWRGESSLDDACGQNPGVPEGSLAYSPGEVGQAFNFNGVDTRIRVPASPSLNVGLGDGFTFEAWINPANITQSHDLVEWSDPSSGAWYSVDFGIEPGGYFSGAFWCLDDGAPHWFITQSNPIQPNIYQHVAFTYDRHSGIEIIYVNGALVEQVGIAVSTPLTAGDVYFGGPAYYQFAGQMDEISLYNRVLSLSEIQSIYNAGSAGKCPTGTGAILIHTPSQ